MKLFTCVILLSATSLAFGEIVDADKITSTTFSAPLRGIPNGWKYTSTPTLHSKKASWGAGSGVIPSIAFGVADDKGTDKTCSKKTAYPIHFGTDYAAPKATAVYAIADGYIKKHNYFTTKADNITIVGDTFVVVESGSKGKLWTTTYGHLEINKNIPWGVGTTKISKGDLVGYLYNFTYAGDAPHLHLGVRKGEFVSGVSTRGFECKEASSFKSDFAPFVSPESLKYETGYY